MTEVENALVQIDRHQVFIDALRRQLKAANDSHEEAFIRYRNGLNDYLPVQTALINSQNLERNTIAADHDLLVFRVQLHLALGGDWMAALSPSNSEDGGA
jgi:outer membrane protein TolC